MANTAPTGTVPSATAAPALTPAQINAKADAKAASDATVAVDPSAVHAVNTLPTSGKAVGSAGVGAGVGFLVGGPLGALLGLGAGWVIEKYRIAGGPVGKAYDAVKARYEAHKAAKPAGQ
jgi:hypothetical protein